MGVRFLDLSIKDKRLRDELLDAIDRVLEHGQLINGAEVEELESRVAQFCSKKHCVGVGSGTDALLLGLKALGIGSGDEVITTSLSWIATANAIALSGATPVFADIDETLNIDPSSIEALITSKTKAIMPVHYTGRVCDMEAINSIAKKHNLLVIEDASQAFGARRDDKVAGSFGDMACFSLNPMKIYAAIGEAGVVLTNDETIKDRLVSLRYNGTINKEICIEPSLNGRLDTIQAAVLLKRFCGLGAIIKRRREIAKIYDEMLKGIVETPLEAANESQIYYTYTIKCAKRDELKAHLDSKGIETKIQHPLLMPHQKPYSSCVSDTKRASELVKKILCIPVHEKLRDDEVELVAREIGEFLGARGLR